MKTSVFARALFASAFMLAFTPAISLAAMPGCSVNWVNGDCGVAKSDDSAHKGKRPKAEPEKPDCEEETASAVH